MEFLSIAALLAVGAALTIYSLLPKKSDEISEAINRRTKGLEATSLQDARRRSTGAATMFEKAAPLLSKPVMPKNEEEQSTLRAKLASAGFRRESAVLVFLASKTATALVGGIIGAVLAVQGGKDLLNAFGQTILGAGIGFMLPNVWLRMSVKKRSEAIGNGLPDSLDLMVVAVEAGLGLDAAIQRVSLEMGNAHPALAEEFQIATTETQMGVPRIEALSKMANRTGVSQMRALVAVIAQAEKLGTSVAKALRIQAETLRTKRRQAAEERAQKTAVKLLLPLILFIFPTIFVVLAGPAAIQLMNTFSGDTPSAN